MPTLSGPELDKMREDLIVWYTTTKQYLIDVLTERYPYGSTPLTTDEQVQQYLSMTPEDWQMLIGKLEERFRGMPDAQEKVQQQLNNYIKSMDKMRLRRQGWYGYSNP